MVLAEYWIALTTFWVSLCHH